MAEPAHGPSADPYRRRGTRFRSRRRAASLLFEAEMRSVDATELARERQELGALNAEIGEVSEFARSIVEGVDEHRTTIDDAISDHLDGWVLDRIPAVDRAILRVGAWELLYGPAETPRATIIDQAVLLTADIAAEKSMAYVNAVLDQIAGLAEHIKAAEAAVAAMDESSGAEPGEDSSASDDSAESAGDDDAPTTGA
ncbi:MAG TPA: transcription antitermination factor NusB [Dietzia timorensis]|uniref:Transcription antitermination protein NusB n=1 Tax=Dietzia timorensis TaxID=499555 RepID=A0A921JZG3_9ACTN|nr:transcription antitermination factor NusB [Dietzia timorensis]HJE92179.1 transcription antitermination factor NusB [Dietzia timorensis]